MIDIIKRWAKPLLNNIYALYLASKDARVPVIVKIITAVVVAYAVSPIDLIPDFIPIIGYLNGHNCCTATVADAFRLSLLRILICRYSNLFTSYKMFRGNSWIQCQFPDEHRWLNQFLSLEAQGIVIIPTTLWLFWRFRYISY